MATTTNLDMVLLEVNQTEKEATINSALNKIDEKYGELSKTLYVNTAQVGNAGSSVETDAFSYSLPENTLANDGESIDFEFSGKNVSSASGKNVKMYLGSTVIFQSGSIMTSNPGFAGSWRVNGSIYRTSETSQVVTATWSCGHGTTFVFAAVSETTEDLSTALTIRGTLTSASAGAVTSYSTRLRWNPTV